MLEVWGRRNAVLVIPVMWAIAELEIPHTFRMAGGAFGVVDTPEYLAMNPTGKIPTIRDGEFCLHEAQAVIRYLCGRYGQGTLAPTDPEALARADAWMEWCRTEPFPVAVAVFFGLVRTPPEERDMAFVSAKAAALGSMLEIADHHLATHRFLAGDTLTMADIPLGCLAYRFYNLEIDRPELPHFERWYQELSQRPAYQTHVMQFFGRTPEEWAAFERTCNAA